MKTLTEVGAYEVKTHLAEFLRKVRSGETYRITQRGEPVADLVPVDRPKKQNAMRAAGRMRQFMDGHPPIKLDIKSLIEAGRD
jgi:prevent-host-death family protein